MTTNLYRSLIQGSILTEVHDVLDTMTSSYHEGSCLVVNGYNCRTILGYYSLDGLLATLFNVCKVLYCGSHSICLEATSSLLCGTLHTRTDPYSPHKAYNQLHTKRSRQESMYVHPCLRGMMHVCVVHVQICNMYL